jgi:hypothetical protein
MRLQFVVVSIPLSRPANGIEIEASLAEALLQQVGAHALVRWAITAVENNHAIVEAVVTTS